MNFNLYRFRSVWTVSADLEKTFSVLSDLSTYPRWWPEVKDVDLLAPDRADVTITALLPYSLRFVMTQEIVDRESGILRAGLKGDLDGFSSWKMTQAAGGCMLVFEEEVEAKKQLLRTLAPVARPAFTLNHGIMMHRGQAGLRKYLSDLTV